MSELVERGKTKTFDAIFRDGNGDAADATTPLVSIQDPSGADVVTNAAPTAHPATGHYQYAYPVAANADLGAWEIDWSGTVDGVPLAVSEGFTVIPAGSITTLAGGGSGPCTPWVTLGELVNDPRAKKQNGDPIPDTVLDTWREVAGQLLYAFSGRQFAGICIDTVRPCRRFYKTGGTPFWWHWNPSWGTFSSRSPQRDAGNGPLSEITLGAYPLRDIIEIRIDGNVVDPTTYRIDDQRYLVRIDPSGVGWPSTQNLAADPMTDNDTFQVVFEWGQAPPAGGVEACKLYAIELAKGSLGDRCALPERVQSLQMQGVSYALLDPMAFLDKGRTGIYMIDAWLAAVNPHSLKRRSSVISPDIPRPVRRTSTTPGS